MGKQIVLLILAFTTLFSGCVLGNPLELKVASAVLEQQIGVSLQNSPVKYACADAETGIEILYYAYPKPTHEQWKLKIVTRRDVPVVATLSYYEDAIRYLAKFNSLKHYAWIQSDWVMTTQLSAEEHNKFVLQDSYTQKEIEVLLRCYEQFDQFLEKNMGHNPF